MLTDQEFDQYDDALNKSLEEGDFQNILKYSKLLIQHLKSFSEPDYNGISFLLGYIGYAYVQLEQLQEGLDHYIEALEIRKRFFPSSPEEIATLYNDVGETYDRMHNCDDALNYYKIALEIREKILPHEHLDIALSCNNIGAVLIDMQRYEEALTYHTMALEIRKKLRPPEHEDILVSQMAIGVIHNLSGKHDTALDIHMQTLTNLNGTTLKSDFNHPDEMLRLAPAVTNGMIAATCFKEGRYDDALKHLNDALAIQKEVLPENHPDIASTYEYISAVYRNLGMLEEAMHYMELSLKIQSENE